MTLSFAVVTLSLALEPLGNRERIHDILELEESPATDPAKRERLPDPLRAHLPDTHRAPACG